MFCEWDDENCFLRSAEGCCVCDKDVILIFRGVGFQLKRSVSLWRGSGCFDSDLIDDEAVLGCDLKVAAVSVGKNGCQGGEVVVVGQCRIYPLATASTKSIEGWIIPNNRWWWWNGRWCLVAGA